MGTKASLGGPYLGHSASMGEQDVADVLGVERVGEALRARCFLSTNGQFVWARTAPVQCGSWYTGG